MSHPLLPSQAIHDPISKLVAAASAADRATPEVPKSGASGRDGSHRRALARKAEEKVKFNLARLLGTIWRKLREESALLDFFLRQQDTHGGRHPLPALTEGGRGGDLAAGVEGGALLSLDVFSSLVPLLERTGRVGLCAREACLVALSVKDRRVGLFINRRTSFSALLSGAVTARYLALYDVLEDLQTAATPPPSAKKGASKDPRSATQLGGAREAISSSLELFLQYLQFCNAVCLVAADTHASTRPRRDHLPRGAASSSRNGGVPESANGLTDQGTRVPPDGDVASSLVSLLRQMLLRERMGPALSSASETRAKIAQAIVARMITELSAGGEGYGSPGGGMAIRGGEGGCRRRLGPLLNAAASFLVGREESRVTGALGKRRMASGGSVAFCSEPTETVRAVLLRRLRCPSRVLRISTLELLGTLAEVRDDQVLLDLSLVSEPPPTAQDTAGLRASGAPMDGDVVEGGGSGGEVLRVERDRVALRALLEQGGPLEGLEVSRDLVNSFGISFRGSSIHPQSRRFASQLSLEGYLVEAHQRQIQQLMEARGRRAREESERAGEVAPLAGAPPAVAVEGGEGEGERDDAGVSIDAGGGPSSHRRASQEFDEREFVEEFGGLLARAADAPGSFLHALFDCLEVGGDGIPVWMSDWWNRWERCDTS